MFSLRVPLLSLVGLVGVCVVPACTDEALGQCADGGDSVCPGGTVCAFGLCVDANDLAAVNVEVEPVASSGLPVQSVFDVDATANDGARVDVVLANGQSLDGSVVTRGGSGVVAAVQAVPLRAIPGRLRVPATTSDDGGAFGLTLLSGADYSLNVTPAGDEFPPLEITPIDAGYEDAIVVDADDLVTLRGRVVNSDSPQPGLEVLVQKDRRRLSTIATTDGEGRFVVHAHALPAGAQLVVRPTEANRVAPTVVVLVDDASGDVDLGDIFLGASSGRTVPVAGTVTGSEGPARGALVVFRALVGAGVFEDSVEAGDDGRFVIDLIAGSYSVGAVPAVDSRAGLLVLPESLEVVEATPIDDLILPLPSRRDASVRITTADGVAVASASVTLQRVGDEFGLAESVLEDVQPLFLGSTDTDGNANLIADTGRYRLTIQPPRGAGAPVFSTLITIDGNFTRDFVLPPQAVFAGIVVDEDGNPAGGSFVRVFSRLVDEQGQAIFLGDATCEADGSFAVSVPDFVQ